MAEMVKLHILFGQRVQSYPGQYAPEAIAIMDEWAEEENPDWLVEQKEAVDASNDFEVTEIITVEVSLDAIRARLNPQHEAIAGKVID